MRYWDAVFAFLVATAVAALLTPFAGHLARKIGAESRPSDRGLSERETPLLGGLAILAGVLIAAAIWMPGTVALARAPHSATGSAGHVHTWVVMAGAVLIAVVGAIDDAMDLPPVVKLLGQVAAAIVAVIGGVLINDLTIPFLGQYQFLDAAYPLTVIWLVALMNIVNFSDGVDGLAAGVCTIGGVAFAVIAFNLQGGSSAAAVLAALTAGGALGFLFHNFPPAKIFMGDTGANLLGYLLGVAAVMGSLKTNAVVALVLPLLVLAVPFLDTGFVVAKRLKYRHAPWHADDEHFHHRMARIGFSQRKTIAYLYAWTVLVAGAAVSLALVPYHDRVHHTYRLGWSILVAVILLFAALASVYLIYVLEILKFKSLRTSQLRRDDPDTSEHEIIESIEHEIETGEFEAVKGETGEFEEVKIPEPHE
jgi:UDP-GlcNAc:undecaprenyl-phosphate GlcNAc-1-phosphate transferase